MVENNKRIAEIDSQLSQTQLNLKYQVLRAPVSGTVFDLQAHAPGCHEFQRSVLKSSR